MHMERSCGACGKTVYPTEELRCLDKLWHKSCFRCQECRKILGIHNFKGHGGKPYCNVHYPLSKSFTQVSDTPEMQQVAINTKNMSKIQYHRDYELSRGRQASLPESQASFDYGNEFSRTVETPPMQQQSYSRSSTGEQVKKVPLSPESYSFSQPPMNVTNGNARDNYAKTNTQTASVLKNDNVGKSKESVEEEGDAVPIYRPDLVMIGGMKVTGSGLHFQAVYSYEAAEDDEVSFVEGDEILHGEPIDEGWMFGTVRRTGQFGMLPSNYVVPIQNPNYNP
ncbi:LIM and SH3 domain protein 1 [Echinococcus multilocularis]|uniref:LIM and SH3 domain protein 1 n=1 Tax=Echinococcus multilocularis TaxID=6211 RepID=A0A068YCP0_ECHMU|nr:LIM and SH3 domain protein 1 [Echinococcus multilocularis]